MERHRERLGLFDTACAKNAGPAKVWLNRWRKSSMPSCWRCPMAMLEHALQYAERGLSVIPIKPDKKPFIPWADFQKRRATPEEISGWWKKWPDAMIGIGTGSISGIFVIDCDTREGYQAIQKHIPENLLFPMARTPRD